MPKLQADQIEAVKLLFHAPDKWQSMLHSLFAVPITYLTPYNDAYHLYLVEIFHKKAITMLSHFIFVPMQMFFWMVFANQVSNTFLPPNNVGSLTVAALLGYYYLRWGITVDKYLFGCITATFVIVISILANMWDIPSFERNVSIAYKLLPLACALLSSWMCSVGHVIEDYIPPFISGSRRWLKREVWMQGKSVLGMVWTLILGAVDEFLAVPHVFPMLILMVMCKFGYASEFYSAHLEKMREAVKNNQPNVHAYGDKGGSYRLFKPFVKIPKTLSSPETPATPSH